MSKRSDSLYMKILWRLLILLLTAKAATLGVLYFLPGEGVEERIAPNYNPPYERISFNMMLEAAAAKEQPAQNAQTNAASGINIANMILKGLYGKGAKGFVVVAMKSNPKESSVIGIGENYKGYELKSIEIDHALLSKGGSDFILRLQEGDSKTATKAALSQKAPSVNIDVPVGVKKDDIAFYAKNPNQIWKEISIVEVKENNQIKGFRVTRIDPQSRFAQLGLEKNDVIIKANNVELKSYRDAIDIYGQIDKLQSVQIVFLRDNQEKEIVYDIY